MNEKRERKLSGQLTDRNKNVMLSTDSLNEDLTRFKEAESRALEALNQRNQNDGNSNADLFSPIMQSEDQNHYVSDEKFRLSLNSTNLNPRDRNQGKAASPRQLQNNAQLKSLTERSPCKEDDYNDESDQSEDKTEDDVGEEIDHNLYSYKDHISLMSPTEKQALQPRIKVQSMKENQDDDNGGAATARVVQTPISSGSFSKTH